RTREASPQRGTKTRRRPPPARKKKRHQASTAAILAAVKRPYWVPVKKRRTSSKSVSGKIWEAARRASTMPEAAKSRAPRAAAGRMRRARPYGCPPPGDPSRAAGPQIHQRKAGAASSSAREMKWTALRNGYHTAVLACVFPLSRPGSRQHREPELPAGPVRIHRQHFPGHGVLPGPYGQERHDHVIRSAFRKLRISPRLLVVDPLASRVPHLEPAEGPRHRLGEPEAHGLGDRRKLRLIRGERPGQAGVPQSLHPKDCHQRGGQHHRRQRAHPPPPVRAPCLGHPYPSCRKFSAGALIIDRPTGLLQ